MAVQKKLRTRRQFRSFVKVVSLAMVVGAVGWIAIMRPGPLEATLDLTCPLIVFFVIVGIALAVNPKEWRKEILSRHR